MILIIFKIDPNFVRKKSIYVDNNANLNMQK